MLLCHPFEILSGHSPHLVAECFPVVLRPLRPLVVDEHPQHLRTALELPRKGLDQTRLGRLQLVIGDEFVPHLGDLLHHDLGGQGDCGVLALESSAKVTGIEHPGRERRSNRIGEPLVASDLLHQPTREATCTENLVEEQKRDRIGIVSRDRAAAHHHLPLRNLLRHMVEAGLQHGRGRDGISHRPAPLPAGKRLFELPKHLLLVEVARHRHDHVPRVEDAAVHFRQAVPGDRRHRAVGWLRRLEVVGAVDEPFPLP